jgi:hypothetical protein
MGSVAALQGGARSVARRGSPAGGWLFYGFPGAPRYHLATQREHHLDRRRESGFINMARHAGCAVE